MHSTCSTTLIRVPPQAIRNLLDLQRLTRRLLGGSLRSPTEPVHVNWSLLPEFNFECACPASPAECRRGLGAIENRCHSDTLGRTSERFGRALGRTHRMNATEKLFLALALAA